MDNIGHDKDGNSAQRATVNNELLLRKTALENSISPIVFLDPDWNLTYANNAFLELWEFNTENEVLGKPVTEF
ncbi:PAS domain-containing protein [Methanohalophilus levihalophilus]|uniref:PAS domain-containing protein n=1 Tax=Methanohalophilus levihalophilus TaxID=1431282 RepID=UPI001AE537D2|nr:PAS domain-containing protein [Methanohalophilus levihalophilus]